MTDKVTNHDAPAGAVAGSESSQQPTKKSEIDDTSPEVAERKDPETQPQLVDKKQQVAQQKESEPQPKAPETQRKDSGLQQKDPGLQQKDPETQTHPHGPVRQDTPIKENTGTRVGSSPATFGTKRYRKSYRIQGVSKDHKKGDLKNILDHLIKNDSTKEITVHSLAYEPTQKGPKATKTATISFERDLEPILDGKIKESHHINNLTMDGDFIGFTPLDSSEADDYDIDFIAIHGLGGHPFGSFKERSGEHMWLRDSLPQNIGKVRVLTYGYDSRVPNSKSFQDLTAMAGTFRAALKTVRVSGEQITFVIESYQLLG
ncbi:hypothetical protein GP486_006564 [Trichoglossum hirsutum]|uniref:Uncharacterized protein n=1 Tax=Trichoglossum hirsutum TaxID=265104 RepID=A0A9P8III0_9PEZI|nr:hypothetical protein GP486_006564 [Trichoglossum hirsutum]